MVFVFDFGFGERGFVMHAPINRAQTFVDESVFVEREECVQHYGLVAGVHSGVWLIESSKDSDALELLALEVEIFLRVLAAFGTDVERAHLKLLAAEFFINLDLDRETVAVPARDVGGIHAGHGFGLHNEVLQALIHGRAEVDGAAGVGRPIMQNVLRRSLPSLANALVDGHLLPALEHLRLVLGQIGLH